MEGLAVLATFSYEAPSYGTLETERERERERERAVRKSVAQPCWRKQKYE